MRLWIFTFLSTFSFICNVINAQDYTHFDCSVKVNNNDLKYPFTGGFSAPQFSNIDLNQDGIKDLFVFDRIGNVPMFFEYEGTGSSSAYNYIIEYKKNVPDNICCWALARDYNDDGIEDLFSVPIELGINGMALYEASIKNGIWSYDQKKMGGDPDDLDLVWYDFASSTFPVTVPFNDLPDIIDVDFDGDLDVLSFDLDGSFISFYQNMQIEEGLPADTMVFEIGDFCFGKIKESGLSENIFLSDNPNVCAENIRLPEEELNKHGLHSGSTVMAFDNDEDNDMDLIIGDLTNDGVVFLENGGTSSANFMTDIDTVYPKYDLPVQMSIFLGAFNVDVNGDNLKDLIITPNQKSSITNTNNIWLYENTGDKENRFTFKSRDFLASETLDFGSYSYPVFVDYNADGLMDIVVTTDGEFGQSGPAKLAMYLFENIGSKSNPSFELVDDDYLGFRAFSSTSRNPSPSFGDLDGDQDIDLLIGDNEGKLYFFENIAGPGQALSFKTPIYNYMDIDDGGDAKPEIVDLNEDGLGDIVVGNRISEIQDGTIGSLRYFQNQGSIGNAIFNPDASIFPNTLVLGEVDVRTSTSGGEAILSSPCFIKYENKFSLLVGSDSKGINLYSDIENNLYESFTFERSNLGDLKEGRAITVDAFDIDNDGFLELLIGNRRGGISFYNSDLESQSVSISEIALNENELLFPNPSAGIVNLRRDMNSNVKSITVYNGIGQIVENLNPSSSTFNLTHLEDGIYFVILSTEKGNMVQKIIKI